jgi:hypothetical protein
LKGQFNAEGDPVYLISAGVVVGTNAPAHLRKGAATPKKPTKKRAARKKGAA